MTFAAFKTPGYTLDNGGDSGAFGWYAPTPERQKWIVVCKESTFSKDEFYSQAVVDDFGNLVRVAA